MYQLLLSRSEHYWPRKIDSVTFLFFLFTFKKSCQVLHLQVPNVVYIEIPISVIYALYVARIGNIYGTNNLIRTRCFLPFNCSFYFPDTAY